MLPLVCSQHYAVVIHLFAKYLPVLLEFYTIDMIRTNGTNAQRDIRKCALIYEGVMTWGRLYKKTMAETLVYIRCCLYNIPLVRPH